MNRIIKAAAILYMLFPFQAALAGWRGWPSKDEMTGEIRAYAVSDKVTSTTPMDFPYTETRSWLGFGCDTKGNEWAYIGFSTLNLISQPARDYNVYIFRVKFDDEVIKMKMEESRNSDFLHFWGDAEAIRRFISHTMVKLELDWYGQGKVYFEYSLEGSSDAIRRAREICRQ